MRALFTRPLAFAFGVFATLLVGVAPGALATHQPGHTDNSHNEFKLTGTATIVADPENAGNDVIRLTSGAGGAHGAVARILDVKIDTLDNQLEAKWRFLSGSCGAGSPRLALAVDRDGDGDSDGAAFGYFGDPPNFTACPAQVWRYQDLTDERPVWDLTQFGGPFYNTWSQVEAFFDANPNHNVCAARLVHDSGVPPGTVDFDLISMGYSTWTKTQDGQGQGDPFAPGRDPCGGKA